MNQVKVNKGVLLKKVTLNRETHLAEFNEAYGVWVQACIDYYLTQVESLKTDNVEKDSLKKPQRPTSFVAEYDRILGMLQMSVDDEITLTAKEFEQYVMDNWIWSESFKSLASSYKGL